MLAKDAIEVFLQNDGDTLAATDASGTKSVLGASSVQSVSQMTSDSSAGSTKTENDFVKGKKSGTYGWPMAMAPPQTLVLSLSRPSSFWTARN